MKSSLQNSIIDPYKTGFLLVFAYPERIAHARAGNSAQFQLANGALAVASPTDELAFEPWLAIAHLNGKKEMGRIFLASPLDPTDLAPLIQSCKTVKWDSNHGEIVAKEELKIGSIILKSTHLKNPGNEQIMEAISEAIHKEGTQILAFTQEVTEFQNRVLSLKKWNPEKSWPDFTTEALIQEHKNWLSPYLQGCKNRADLKRIDLLKALKYSLPEALQKEVNTLAPERLKVPSGSQIKLKYKPDGAPPILAARLQELFGLSESPSINRGKTQLLIHLLSPGYKPVQVTSDLKSFWNKTYFEVKKELKRRYPKHAWPDDPWNEPPKRK